MGARCAAAVIPTGHPELEGQAEGEERKSTHCQRHRGALQTNDPAASARISPGCSALLTGRNPHSPQAAPPANARHARRACPGRRHRQPDPALHAGLARTGRDLQRANPLHSTSPGRRHQPGRDGTARLWEDGRAGIPGFIGGAPGSDLRPPVRDGAHPRPRGGRGPAAEKSRRAAQPDHRNHCRARPRQGPAAPAGFHSTHLP